MRKIKLILNFLVIVILSLVSACRSDLGSLGGSSDLAENSHPQSNVPTSTPTPSPLPIIHAREENLVFAQEIKDKIPHMNLAKAVELAKDKSNTKEVIDIAYELSQKFFKDDFIEALTHT